MIDKRIDRSKVKNAILKQIALAIKPISVNTDEKGNYIVQKGSNYYKVVLTMNLKKKYFNHNFCIETVNDEKPVDVDKRQLNFDIFAVISKHLTEVQPLYMNNYISVLKDCESNEYTIKIQTVRKNTVDNLENV